MVRPEVLLVGAVFAFSPSARAHHSFAIFDQAHPIELVGVVEDFKFANPHTFIVLQVKGQNARSMVWQLEGQSANSLTWSGWSQKTLKPGDQLRMIVEPLRSGAPGGFWSPRKVKFLDGSLLRSQLVVADVTSKEVSRSWALGWRSQHGRARACGLVASSAIFEAMRVQR